MRLDGIGLCQDLATLNIVLLDAAQQETHVVTGTCFVEKLAEHFDVGNGGLDRVLEAHEFHFFHLLEDSALDTTGCDSAATFDVEHVFHRHQEGLVHRTLGKRDVLVHRVHEISNALGLRRGRIAGLQCRLRRTLDDRNGVAGEFVGGEQVTHFHLNEFEKLGIVHHVALVQENDDGRHADLTGQKNMLAGLGHRAVSSAANQDRTVHLGCASDHVFNIISVAGAVDVRVVALFGLILDVGGVDRDSALFFFGSGVDFVVFLRLCEAFLGKDGGDRCSQRRLAVVHVANSANVDVRFRAFELRLGHKVRSVGF